MVLIGGVKGLAADNTTVNAPTITPTSCDYNGTIMPVISADEGCSIVYVKSTSKLYTTVEAIDGNKGVKTENSNKASITDIVGKTGNRYISAYAVKDVNGTKYKSAVVNVTYTYNANANVKKTLTLSASSISLDMADETKTATVSVSAKDSDGKEVTGLKYRYEVFPEGVVTIDANGVVTPKQAGTASINVIFEGNDTYNAATCVVDVNVASNASSTTMVYTSIADIRHAGQSFKGKKSAKCVLDFTKNPATVIAIMKNHDKDINDDEKFIGSYFIIDSSNRGLWISAKDMSDKLKVSSTNLAVGSKITGIIVGTYNESTSGIPGFSETGSSPNAKVTYNNVTYTTDITVDNSEIGKENLPASYPFTEVKDVNTIAATNNIVTDGDIVKSSYGVYLNSIIKVPGTIRKKINSGDGEINYYLMQDENTKVDGGLVNRIYFNSSQIDVNLDDYVGTSGEFEGILVKRDGKEPKLIVLKDNFFQINKIYLDENDSETRIDDLVNAGAFDDEVDVYVHRTKLVNSKSGMWNTICLPFDLTAEEFKKAFGCEISALAVPKVSGEETINGRFTKIGETDNSGNLLFESQSDLSIKEGMPYLIKATGTQTACTNASITYKNNDGIKTPQDLMKEDATYYAAIGQKLITVVPPHQIKGNYNNKIVNGEFFFRGLYGGKTYVDGSTEKLIADGGSQKYQYISTADNYLRYLKSGSTSKFPGLRAYFYFPNWDAGENNKNQGTATSTNSKIHILVDGNTTGISSFDSNTESAKARIYNLAGQQVDSSYKGIIIKNGCKYIAK